MSNMLKLIDLAYPDPERPTLVNEYAEEVTYDLGKDGSKWAHGYVPLNPAAVALKHHKQPGGDGDGGSTAKGLASRDGGAGSRRLSGDLAAERRRDPSAAAHHKESAALNGFRLDSKPTAAKSEPDDHGFPVGSKAHVKGSGDPDSLKWTVKSHDAAGNVKLERSIKAGRSSMVQGATRHHSQLTASDHRGYPETAKVQVYNVKTGKSEYVSPAEANAGHARYGQSLGAGSAAAGQTVKNALEAEKARRAAISDAQSKLADNAAARSTLEGHAAALAVPIKDRTADQQKAAADALAYAKELRAKRLAKKSPPKVKQAAPSLRGRKTPAVRGSQSVAGVRFNDSQAQRGQR